MTTTTPAAQSTAHRVPALEVRDLYVTYPARAGRGPARAVDGVNLQLREGEVLALIGESGCGKSTLARALTGLVRPTSGQVLRRGVPLRYTSAAMKEHRKDVQFVLQDPGGALNPRQNVRAAVAEGPRLHGMTDALDQRVHDALSKAGLRPPHEYLSRFPHQMSGGQQQRVVIAGALALEPSVIVADEPVASLDASVRGEILRLLLDLRGDLGLSSLVVSHDLGLAWNIADRVAVMYLGRVVEVGTVEEVLLHPQHPYTKALLSVLPEGNSPSRRPVLLAGEAPDPTEVPAGCRFHPRCPLWASLDAGGRAEAGCDRRTLPVLDGVTTSGAQAACHLVGAS
ncbi:ABC transporter ATP-binding protein [Streptomyces sp. CO7]